MPGLLWNAPGLTWNGNTSTPIKTTMPKIVLNLNGLTDTEVLTLADKIATGLTANAADFPQPDPTPAQISAARTAANTALTDAKLKDDASKAAYLTKDATFSALELLLTNSASWAERKIADPVKLQKVFDLKKTATPTGAIAQTQGLAITFGDNPGELDLIWQPDPKARSYEIQSRYLPQPGADWAHAKTSTKSKVTLTGLNSGKTAQLRVRTIGPKDLEGPWSDLAEHLVP